MGAANAGEDRGDMAIGARERLATLGKIPGEGGEPSVNGRDRTRLAIDGGHAGGLSRDVEPAKLRVGEQSTEGLAPAPGRVSRQSAA